MHKLLILLNVLASTQAHMSPFLSAMYGGPNQYRGLQDPVAPLGPGLEFDDWWFRGPKVRNAPPEEGEVAILKAGSNFTLEIACAPEYTTMDGSDPNGNVACDEPGPYHADPDAEIVNPDLLSGCAIGIADVMDPNDATMDDFVIFSVQAECILTRNTTFAVPAAMPSCTGEYCICGWVWSPQTGVGNAYHTPFRCKVTNSPVDAQPIAPPNDPVYCPDSRDDCTRGAKRLISTYNYPVNVPWTSNDDRPGYHDTFGFFNGPQDDIFLPLPVPAIAPSTTITSSTSSSFATSAVSTTAIETSKPPSSSAKSSTSTQLASSSSTSSPSRPIPVSSSMATSRVTSTSSHSSSKTSISSTSTTSKLVWLPVPTTTPHWVPVITSRTTTATASSASATHPPRLPYKEALSSLSSALHLPSRAPRLPWVSRHALPSTTTMSTPSTGRTRKSWRDRTISKEAALETALAKKGRPHLKRGREFGSASGGSGIGERMVDKMRKMVTNEIQQKREAKKFEKPEKLVWTRVEL